MFYGASRCLPLISFTTSATLNSITFPVSEKDIYIYINSYRCILNYLIKSMHNYLLQVLQMYLHTGVGRGQLGMCCCR